MCARATTRTAFDATAPVAGYLYQCRLALLLLLQKLSQGSVDGAISIERFDDVAFEVDGTPLELIQSKHHLASAPNLTDGSAEVWKTLRVWAEGLREGRFRLPATSLFLITTGRAGEGTAMSKLRSGPRDPAEALRLLETAAAIAEGEGLRRARDAFFSLSRGNRLALLSNCHVLDNAANVEELGPKIDSALGFPVKRDLRQPFRDRLEGWWFSRIIERLTHTATPPVAAVDLMAAMDGIRDSFREDALPVDYAEAQPNRPPLAEDTRLFVRQLRAIRIGARTIDWARVDFYRAFEQRSRWVRDQLLAANELDRYDRTLLEHWQREFDRHQDEINEGDGEPELVDRGKAIYTKCTDTCPPIRPRCTDTYVGRGSLHLLSDGGQVGWHPRFREQLLAGETAP